MHALDLANLVTHTDDMAKEPSEPVEKTSYDPPIPSLLSREAEFQARLAEQRASQWRRRRMLFAVVTPLMGTFFPVVALLLAGGIANGSMMSWISEGGWLTLIMTVVGSAMAALLALWRGWGIIRGMMLYAGVFSIILVVTRTANSTVNLLPAMPGLVSIFVMTGAIVGYLIVIEEGE